VAYPVLSPIVGDIPVPAPANWPQPAPVDSPVLRNALWQPLRSIARGIWTIGVYGSGQAMRVLAMQDYVVDDFGSLCELSPAAAVANSDWYASTYAIDQAACEWMDQFTPSAPQPAPAELGVKVLQEPYFPFCAKSIVVDDDHTWRAGQPLYSVHAERDTDCLLLTTAELRALAHALMAIANGTKGPLQ
jgi:hypothetical protein